MRSPRWLSSALTLFAVGLAIIILIAIVKRDRSIAPTETGRKGMLDDAGTTSPTSAASDPCRSIPSGDVDLIARHAACEAACSKNDMAACGLAATNYVTGLGAPPDGARALELYEKACASREAPSACLLLGDLLDDGALVARDSERANQAWSSGCAQGDRASCARRDGGR